MLYRHGQSGRDGADYGQDGGHDRGGYGRGHDRGGYDRGGYDHGSYDPNAPSGHSRGGFDRGGYDSNGRGGYGRSGYAPQPQFPTYAVQDAARSGYDDQRYGDQGGDGGHQDRHPPDDQGYDYDQYSPDQGSPGHYYGDPHGQPSSYGGSRPRRPAPRPPPSRKHGQVPLAEPEFQQDSDDGEGRLDPTGIRRFAAEAGSGGGSPASGADGEAVVDPALVAHRLGKVREARHVPRRGPPPGTGGERPSVNDIERLPPAPQWKCGPSRVKLRRRFNRKEIDVATLMRKYDTNHNWKLEQDEFLHLLQDYNHWFQHINRDEVEMVLQLADFDHDECIEPNEVIYAMRVWYAYVNMPTGSVGQAVAHLSDCGMPGPEVLKEAMLVMNEEQPVELEEAEYVRHIALALGGTEQRVTSRQMRMAVAAWYLHVERKDTPHGELVKHAIGSTHERICLQNPLQRCLRGQWDLVTMWLNGVGFLVWCVVPGVCIWVGSTTDTSEYPCERPMLSMMMVATGFLGLVHGMVILWLTAAWECRAMKKCKLVAGITLLVLTFILLMVWMMGLWQVLTVRPSNCGFLIFELAHFVWIGCPALSSFFLCCCIPCMYCHEYCKHKNTDQELMDNGDSGLE